MAGKFPSEYINALISGQALGGIFASVANIISIALGASPVESAFIYFVAADITLIVSFGLYIFLSSSEFFLHYSTMNTFQSKFDRRLNVNNEDGVSNGEEEPILGTRFSYRQIIYQIWPYLFSIGLVYIVTLSLFPAVAVLVQSFDRDHGYAWNDDYFTPVACFLLMNMSDYIGRASVVKMTMPNHPRFWTCALSVLRIGFFPLMMMCNAQPRTHFPVVIQSDVGFIIIMALFGLSNGYISNVCFTAAPKAVAEEGQETAASLMAASLAMGLALGGTLSNAVVNAL